MTADYLTGFLAGAQAMFEAVRGMAGPETVTAGAGRPAAAPQPPKPAPRDGRDASRPADRRTALAVSDGPKMLRESLCVAQASINAAGNAGDRKVEHITRLGRLIAACDELRPLGTDGKHGDHLHTPECGCEDKPREPEAVGVPIAVMWALTPQDLDRRMQSSGPR
ncbi:MAG: hypothetical protein H7Z19_04945 [Chitinophagaceae bacterium]|nr:hypothetical protein [Rubrivivax sp.]